MKRKLDYMWKRASKRPCMITTNDHKRKSKESAYLLTAFRAMGFKFIFIDEYAANSLLTRNYKWAKRNEDAMIVTLTNLLSWMIQLEVLSKEG